MNKIKQIANIVIWIYALVISVKGLGELARDHAVTIKNRMLKK